MCVYINHQYLLSYAIGRTFHVREIVEIKKKIWVSFFLTELMVAIYSKGLVRAIGKVLLMKFS